MIDARRVLLVLSPILLLGAALVLVASIPRTPCTAEGAGRPTRTPTPSPTACESGLYTPGVSDDISDGFLHWTELSENVDGFYVDISMCSQSFHYEVPARTTSLKLPPEVLSLMECYHCGCHFFEVTAFNSCGQAIGTTGLCSDCAPLPTATPYIAPPPTGDGDYDGHEAWWLVPLGIVGAACLTVGLVSVALLRGKGARGR
jgi:hypothetical protein